MDPGRRVVGAWEHVLDRLAERGIDAPPSLTADEVVARAGRQLGPAGVAPIEALVPVVDTARYDRRFPPSQAAADAAWARATDFDRALRLRTPPLMRLRAQLSPAPLRRVTPPVRRAWANRKREDSVP